jgi:hypothetical protein
MITGLTAVSSGGKCFGKWKNGKCSERPPGIDISPEPFVATTVLYGAVGLMLPSRRRFPLKIVGPQ